MRIAITGSSSGIGRSVADYLESEGHEIKRVDRSELDLRFLDTVSRYDLSNQDVLINNAAMQDPNANFKDTTKENIIWKLNVNLLAPILLTHSFINQNKKIQDKINKLIKEENIDRESLNLDSAKFWRQLLKITGKNADELFSKYKIKAILKDARGSSLEDIVVGGKVEYTVFDPKSLNIVNKKFLPDNNNSPGSIFASTSYRIGVPPSLRFKAFST